MLATASHCEELITSLDEMLESLLVTEDPSLSTLYEAARYAVLGGGKRLRPLLCLLTAEMYGTPLTTVLPVACALELVHSYSLIHDDLPAMDNDDYRRGRPSLHKVYTEGHAILTGDYLLTYGFEIISSCKALEPSLRVALLALLARCGGVHGMIGGQVLDIAGDGSRWSLEELEVIHRKKTGALIQGAIVAGAMVGGASHSDILLLRQVGEELGLAFQIVDDLLDSNGEELALFSDLRDSKVTYVSLLGKEGAREAAGRCRETIERLLITLKRPSGHLLTLITTMIQRDR